VWTDRKTKTGGLVYDHAWDAIMYLEQRTEFWRQEQPPMIKARKRDKTPVITEKMRINNWVSREVDKIDNGMLLLSRLHVTNLAYKLTIRPGFSGTVRIFNDMSRKKITVLPGCPLVPFLAWCPGFVPRSYYTSTHTE